MPNFLATILALTDALQCIVLPLASCERTTRPTNL